MASEDPGDHHYHNPFKWREVQAGKRARAEAEQDLRVQSLAWMAAQSIRNQNAHVRREEMMKKQRLAQHQSEWVGDAAMGVTPAAGGWFTGLEWLNQKPDYPRGTGFISRPREIQIPGEHFPPNSVQGKRVDRAHFSMSRTDWSTTWDGKSHRPDFTGEATVEELDFYQPEGAPDGYYDGQGVWHPQTYITDVQGHLNAAMNDDLAQQGVTFFQYSENNPALMIDLQDLDEQGLGTSDPYPYGVAHDQGGVRYDPKLTEYSCAIS